MQRVILRFYGVLLCLFFALIFSTQILSFLQIYQAITLFPLSAGVMGVALWLYFRADNGWLAQFNNPDSAESGQWLKTSLLIGAVFLLTAVFLIRMVLFPASSLAASIPGDATNYHFIKAIELFRTGSMWDLSITYGEYPVGYEGLIAAGIFIVGDVAFAGVIHALALILLVLTLTLLLLRYTRLPAEIAVIISVGLLFYPDIYGTVVLIGKNDLFISTLLLIAVLHSSIALKPDSDRVHVFGLAMATCMAMSVKPGGYLILGFLWVIVLVRWFFAYRQGNRTYLTPGQFIAAVVLMIPCGLWVIRNFIVMGRMVSPEVASFFQESIFSSLGDPMLYNSGAESVALIGLALWTGLLAVILAAKWRFYMPALLLVVMWAAFITTPLSAFHTELRTTLHIEWRYTLHTFIYMAILCVAIAEPLIIRVYEILKPYQKPLAGVVAAGCVAIVLVIGVDKLGYQPQHIIRLYDVFVEPTGTDGYHSIYDYIHRELNNAVVMGIGAYPYYLYSAPYTNRVMDIQPHPPGMPDLIKRPVPDYLVYIRQIWEPPGTYPDESQLLMPHHWSIIYEDPTGMIYRRVSP